jgi:hypothetical protein
MAWKWICRLALLSIATALLVSCSGFPPASSLPVDTLPEPDPGPSFATTEQIPTEPAGTTPICSLSPSTIETSVPATQPTEEEQPLLEVDTGLPVLYVNVDLAAVYADKDEYQKGTLYLWQDTDDSDHLSMRPSTGFENEPAGPGGKQALALAGPVQRPDLDEKQAFL